MKNDLIINNKNYDISFKYLEWFIEHTINCIAIDTLVDIAISAEDAISEMGLYGK